MAFLLRRLAFYLAAFLAAATVNFFLPRMMPGDPIQIMFSSAGSNLSMENLQALKLTFGFIDAPLGQQYLTYLQSIFSGDLGPRQPDPDRDRTRSRARNGPLRRW